MYICIAYGHFHVYGMCIWLMFIYDCMYICIPVYCDNIRMSVYMYICTHVRMYTYMYMYIRICRCTCLWIWICKPWTSTSLWPQTKLIFPPKVYNPGKPLISIWTKAYKQPWINMSLCPSRTQSQYAVFKSLWMIMDVSYTCRSNTYLPRTDAVIPLCSSPFLQTYLED